MTYTLVLMMLAGGLCFGQMKTPNAKDTDHVEAVAITVTAFGPYPAVVHRPAGPFVLFVLNRSGVLDETFSLVRKVADKGNAKKGSDGEPSLLDLHANQGKHRDQQLIELEPGSYQLRFKSHPGWTVDLVVADK